MSWNELIAAFPQPHFLQTEQWAQVKARFGWQPHYLVWTADSLAVSPAPPQMERAQAAALVLERRIPIGGLAARLSVLYTPKGPLLRSWADAALRERVLGGLEGFARRRGAIFLKMDPDVPLGTGIPGQPEAAAHPLGAALQERLGARGWRYSADQVQFRNTLVLDLQASEDELLNLVMEVDIDGNGTIDGGDFLNGAAVADPSTIRAVRVNILARSDRPDPNYRSLGNPPAAIENRNHNPTNDDFRRRWWQTMVTMRNR